MLRNRFLIMLGLCFLAASATWADDVGYIDCSAHSDATQVFGKPRKSQDVVGSLPCGERFTILVYGFYFSRIQTKDGQVGYIYSSLIAIDRAAASVQQNTQQAAQQAPSLQTAAEKTKIPRTPTLDAQPSSRAATQPQAVAAQPAAIAPAQPAVTPAPAQPTSTSAPGLASSAATVPASATQAADAQPAPVQPATTSPAGLTTPATTLPTPAVSTPDAAPLAAQPSQPAPPQPDPTPTQPSSSPASGAAAASATPTSPDVTANAAQPNPPADAQPAPASAAPQPAAAQPQPEPARAAAPAIRPADTRNSWEKPRPSARTAPLIELYGGYAFARLGGTGTSTNMNGAMGSFGWNAKPWLQVVADTTYSFQTVNGVKNVLYGNHFGPRLFYRARSRWGVTPFAEALVGGSSAKTSVSGTYGYTSSTGSVLSYKAGGGVDVHPSKRWEIRLVDVDYYRTSFGTNLHQNNYWISTGVILRLFGGQAE